MGHRYTSPRSIAAPFFLLLAVFTIVCGLGNAWVPNDWGIGDWLINYRSGFVRRGLPGELIYWTSHLTRISPTWIALALQMLFYAVLFRSVWKLLSRSSWSPWLVVLMLSPATLLFGILDPLFGFRKEILFLAGFSVLLTCRRPPNRSTWVVAGLTLFLPIAVLSHEGVIFYLPYLIAGLVIVFGSVPRALRLGAVPVILAIGAAWVAAHHPGNSVTAEQICRSLHYGSSCPASILYLGNDRQTALADVHRATEAQAYVARYIIATISALLPVLVGFFALWQTPRLRRDLLLIAAAAVLSALGSLILFRFGTDWGRWIYIHIMCLFLLLLALDDRRQADPATAQPIRPLRPTQAVAFAALVLLYLSYWQLGAYQPHFPLGGLAHTLYEYKRTNLFLRSSSVLPPP